MKSTTTAMAVLDRCFLEMRHRVLDLAAALDRVDRADEAEVARSDERMEKLHEAVRLLVDGRGDRAARVHMIFSLPYDPDWLKG